MTMACIKLMPINQSYSYGFKGRIGKVWIGAGVNIYGSHKHMRENALGHLRDRHTDNVITAYQLDDHCLSLWSFSWLCWLFLEMSFLSAATPSLRLPQAPISPPAFCGRMRTVAHCITPSCLNHVTSQSRCQRCCQMLPLVAKDAPGKRNNLISFQDSNILQKLYKDKIFMVILWPHFRLSPKYTQHADAGNL